MTKISLMKYIGASCLIMALYPCTAETTATFLEGQKMSVTKPAPTHTITKPAEKPLHGAGPGVGTGPNK